MIKRCRTRFKKARHIADKWEDFLREHISLRGSSTGFKKIKIKYYSNYVNSKLNDNKHVLFVFIEFGKEFDAIMVSKIIETCDWEFIKAIRK